MKFNAMPLLNLWKEMVFRLTWTLDRRQRVEVFIHFIFFLFRVPSANKVVCSFCLLLCMKQTEWPAYRMLLGPDPGGNKPSESLYCTHHSFSLYCVTLLIYVLMGYMSMLDSRDHGESVISQYNVLNFTALSFYVVLSFL